MSNHSYLLMGYMLLEKELENREFGTFHVGKPNMKSESWIVPNGIFNLIISNWVHQLSNFNFSNIKPSNFLMFPITLFNYSFIFKPYLILRNDKIFRIFFRSKRQNFWKNISNLCWISLRLPLGKFNFAKSKIFLPA